MQRAVRPPNHLTRTRFRTTHLTLARLSFTVFSLMEVAEPRQPPGCDTEGTLTAGPSVDVTVQILCMSICSIELRVINPLTPNDHYSGRTAPLTSKRCILYIYTTNIGTEYFKHGIYSPFFFSSKCSLFHNSNVFGSCIIHILYTGALKLKK